MAHVTAIANQKGGVSLGIQRPDQLDTTFTQLMGKAVNDVLISPGEGVLLLPEGIDLVPGNIELAGLELSLVNVMSRETVMRQYIDTVRSSS